jgi:pantoate--beta-alanine ligase
MWHKSPTVSLALTHSLFRGFRRRGAETCRWLLVRKYTESGDQNLHPTNAHVFRGVPAIRQFRRELLLSNRTVGLVPTMGALHKGHLSLVRMAAQENTDVFISIYVNPTQFGVNEDLSSYPRTWDGDMSALASINKELATQPGMGRISAIFAPPTEVMYPTLPPTSEIEGDGSFVTVMPLARMLEGRSRPVFFRGVATVCMKLFNIVQPETVYFGQKDFQQTAVIKRMLKDFHLPIEFRMGPTMRESDGLAMSSRNVYLGSRRRKAALALSRALKLAKEQYLQGKISREDIREPAIQFLRKETQRQSELPSMERALFKIDYMSLTDVESLEELREVDRTRGAVISGAIIMQPLENPQSGESLGQGGDIGPVRLIDNIILQ